MKFDDLEVGKEYQLKHGDVVRIIDKAGRDVAARFLTGVNVEDGSPLVVWSYRDSFDEMRPYTPPPAPVTIFAYAVAGVGNWATMRCEDRANSAYYRVGPVIKVELPVDPDMLARVKGGAS